MGKWFGTFQFSEYLFLYNLKKNTYSYSFKKYIYLKLSLDGFLHIYKINKKIHFYEWKTIYFVIFGAKKI
jgi:hypothetical protein